MSSSSGNWPKDEFGRSEMFSQFSWLALLVSAILSAVVFYFMTRPSTRATVAYCAQDQLYAEPIFRQFEQQTGAKVRPVFDSEAVKTVGLANRLIAEADHPRCDVFWGNEELRTRQLAARNLFRATNGWAAFGYRSRRMVINTNQLQLSAAPHSLLELTNQAWEGKVALAYPQFGTTATHFHALRQHWGEAAWESWCRALVDNKPWIVDGNSVVVKVVGRGQAWIGLTDSDDILVGQQQQLPLAALPMSSETLLIPNTVAVIRDAPHPPAAEQLFAFLQTPEVLRTLVNSGALEGASVNEVKVPTLQVAWDGLLRDLDTTTEKLNRIFLR